MENAASTEVLLINSSKVMEIEAVIGTLVPVGEAVATRGGVVSGACTVVKDQE
jgi:hypothetical protein